MEYREILGLTSIAVGIISYIPYFRDIFANRTKPHAFYWLVLGVLTAIGFAGQITGNAGPGAWVTGFTAGACVIIFFIALRKGERNIVLVDWLSLIGAVIALILWFVTRGPLLSVILASSIAVFGFIPLFRKSFIKPKEETAITFTLNGFKYLLALFALENFSLVTSLYPFSLLVISWLLVLMLFVRRKNFFTL